MKYDQEVYEALAENERNSPVGIVIEVEEIYGHTFKKRKSKVVQWKRKVEVGQELYIAPRELSDEEIVEIYKSVKQDKDLTWEEWCITWEEWCKEQIEFARAIEERILGK